MVVPKVLVGEDRSSLVCFHGGLPLEVEAIPGKGLLVYLAGNPIFVEGASADMIEEHPVKKVRATRSPSKSNVYAMRVGSLGVVQITNDSLVWIPDGELIGQPDGSHRIV